MRQCNHTSVGMIVNDNDTLLLIERRKGAKGFAPPAGHIDHSETSEDAAKRELFEETGLQATNLTLLTEGRKDNACGREDGSWHYWQIYRADATGSLKKNDAETKQVGWYTPQQVKKLTERTEAYLQGIIPEEEWQTEPGIEIVWHEWFKALGIPTGL